MAGLGRHREGILKISALAMLALTGLSAGQQPVHRAEKKLTTCCSVIDAAIHDHATIKPGAKREDVEKLFDVAGVGATDTMTHYRSLHCSCLWMDITFRPVDGEHHPLNPRDVVVSKSKLYIEVPCLALDAPHEDREHP